MRTNAMHMVAALLGILFCAVQTAIACTIFTVSNGSEVMFGGNEDQTPNGTFIVVDNSGTFGVVYFATPGRDSPLAMQMGINEKGLCYDTNAIPTDRLNAHPGRKHQEEWAVTQLMKSVSTVEEVLSQIPRYDWGDSISYQVHFADRSGDAAVIHPGPDGELTYLRKPRGNGHLVSTNFNMARLQTGNWSCRRYRAANKMLRTIGSENAMTAELIASVLNATRQDSVVRTLYSAVYDLRRGRIHLYHGSQFDAPYVLDVGKELAKTAFYHIAPLRDLFPESKIDEKHGPGRASKTEWTRSRTPRADDPGSSYAPVYAFSSIDYYMQWVIQQNPDTRILDEALKMAQKAVSLDDSYILGNWMLSLLHQLKGEYEQSTSIAEHIIDIAPDVPRIHLRLAHIMIRMGRPEEAIALIEESMRLSPQDSVMGLQELGLAYRLVGRYEEAAEKQELACTESQFSVETTFYTSIELAILYVQLGRMEDTRIAASEVLKASPNFSVKLWGERNPMKDRAQVERDMAALRKAGLN